MTATPWGVPEGFILQQTSSGLVLAAAAAPETLFKNAPARVLGLYVCAAQLQAQISLDVYEATLAGMPAIASLSAEHVFTAVDSILQSPMPDVLAPLLMQQALTTFGLPEPRGCLRALREAPQNRCARWALLLSLCQVSPQQAARLLPLHRLLAVNPAALRAEGVRGLKVAAVQTMLVQAVLRQPALNHYGALMHLAHGFARYRLWV